MEISIKRLKKKTKNKPKKKILRLKKAITEMKNLLEGLKADLSRQ